MRIPVAVDFESRTGTFSKVAISVNGIAEKRGEQLVFRKRPGIADIGLVKAGTAQLLTVWNGIKTIQGDYLNAGSIGTITSGPTQTNLSPTNAGLQFTSSFTTNKAATPRMFFRNRSQGWVVNRAGTVSTVTYASSMGAGTYTVLSLTRASNTATATIAEDGVINVGDSVTVAGAAQAAYNGTVTVTAITGASSTPAVSTPITSLTRSGTTATAVTSIPHGLTNGSSYAISGANEAAYNGTYTVTVVNSTTFTYTVTVTPATAVTWNPADKQASVSLSGGNLTATENTSSAQSGWARATAGKSSGKWYFEITVGTATSGSLGIGIADATEAFALSNDFIGNSSRAVGYVEGGGIWYNGIQRVAGASYGLGAVIGVAVDLDSRSVSFYKNGVAQGSYALPSGTLYPAFTFTPDFVGSAINRSITANFGATSFTYSAPTGYSAYQSDSPATTATGSPLVTIPGTTTNPTFSYTVAGSPATPATGTITVQGSGGTVPGCPYINGYFCVMDTSGVIWSSASDDPTTWPSTQFIYAQNEPGSGKALSKSLNYLIAHKEWSTEFFYNDPNQTNGSPFVPVQNGFTLIGCANGDSVTEVNGTICWIAQTRSAPGRSVYVQTGLEQQKISTPDVERILNFDSLATVYAFGVNLDGHPIYVLTLTNTGVTLAYDFSTQLWSFWTSCSAGSSVNVTSITRSGNVATVTCNSAHGMTDTNPVLMAGATQNEYNGYFVAHVTSTTAFEIYVTGSPTTPATGTITATPYFGSYFKFTKAANYNGTSLLLHATDGHLYQFSSYLHQDNGICIDTASRTILLDGGTLNRKKLLAIRLVTPTATDVCSVRWSDDDAVSWKNARFVDMSAQRPETRRCGAFRRRIIELRHVGNTGAVFEALELEIQ